MSNNKSRKLMRHAGTHKVYEPPSSTLDDERMAQIAKMIVAITGKLEYVYLVSKKFLDLVDQYKRSPQIAQEFATSSNLDRQSVVALFEYFGAMSDRNDADLLIQRMFDARKW
jgi:hypothetical protein